MENKTNKKTEFILFMYEMWRKYENKSDRYGRYGFEKSREILDKILYKCQDFFEPDWEKHSFYCESCQRRYPKHMKGTYDDTVCHVCDFASNDFYFGLNDFEHKKDFKCVICEKYLPRHLRNDEDDFCAYCWNVDLNACEEYIKKKWEQEEKEKQNE